MKKFLLLAFATAMMNSPASADKASYCAAYARDFADQRATDKDVWQHKYQIALDACLASHALKQHSIPQLQQAAKPEALKKPAPPKRVAVASTAQKPKLEEGSAAWNDYCAKKYVSFNKKTGTYMSTTGVVRKCLVTPASG